MIPTKTLIWGYKVALETAFHDVIHYVLAKKLNAFEQQ
jgi:hypothetical protein